MSYLRLATFFIVLLVLLVPVIIAFSNKTASTNQCLEKLDEFRSWAFSVVEGNDTDEGSSLSEDLQLCVSTIETMSIAAGLSDLITGERGDAQRLPPLHYVKNCKAEARSYVGDQCDDEEFENLVSWDEEERDLLCDVYGFNARFMDQCQ